MYSHNEPQEEVKMTLDQLKTDLAIRLNDMDGEQARAMSLALTIQYIRNLGLGDLSAFLEDIASGPIANPSDFTAPEIMGHDH